MSDFQSFIDKERAKLAKQKDDLTAQRQEIDTKLADIDRELFAIDAYETAKAGKPATTPKPPRAASTSTRAPRGAKRDELLTLIKQRPNLSRGDILETLGIKGDKKNEQSVSNALANLKKAGTIIATDGKYTVAA